MRFSTIYLTLFILIFGLTAVVHAQDTVTDDQVNEVAKGLYCPVCESTPLDVCPTQACADWRELIREQLASGMSQSEIYAYFAVQYGDGVLAEPPRRGFSLVLWLSPLLALAVGGVVFVKAMSQLRQSPEKQNQISAETAAQIRHTSSHLQPFIDRIEAELEELPNG